jgi:DNA replication initiation complex subunit (GINS family)
MITYNDIYEAAIKERNYKPLQALPKNFIEEVSDYLNEKKQIALKNNNDFSEVIDKTKKQLESAIVRFKELMRLRREKILGLVQIAAEIGISKQDFDNMLSVEKTLFEEIMKCIDASDKKVSEVLNGRREADLKNDLICFTERIGEFMGVKGDMMGPFEKGQIVNIPKEIARILIDDGKAKIVE